MKVRLAIGPNRGYQPLGSRIYTDKADAPDLNESFKYQHELPDDDPDIVAGTGACAQPLAGRAAWLAGNVARLLRPRWSGSPTCCCVPSRWRSTWTRRWFLSAYRKPLTQINLIHYPPHPPVTSGRQFGLRPHSDTTAFTILAQGDVGGLQVEHGGDWIDVPPVPGSFVINIGDMMARWTNDRFASTPHRVINRSGTERYSVAFFAIPDFDAEVACLPSCMGPGNPPKYPRCASANSCCTAMRRTGTRILGMADNTTSLADRAGAPIERPLPLPSGNALFGSDVVAETLRALEVPFIALNPGSSYRGLHDSLVNYLGNVQPQMLLCLHEEHAVAIAHGYAKVTGRPMAAAVHSNVGLMHATMACSTPGATACRCCCSARPVRWMRRSAGRGSTGSIPRATRAR